MPIETYIKYIIKSSVVIGIVVEMYSFSGGLLYKFLVAEKSIVI